MAKNLFPFGQNVRAYEDRQIGPRPQLSEEIFTVGATKVNSLARMQDNTPAGPSSGFALIVGMINGNLGIFHDAGFHTVQTGFSGNRLAFASYRPNQSVQPWMYIGDSVKMGKILSTANTTSDFAGMGVVEPQIPAMAVVGGSQFGLFPGFAGATWSRLGTGVATGTTTGPVIPIPDAILYDNGVRLGEASVVLTAGLPAGLIVNDVLYGNYATSGVKFPLQVESVTVTTPGNSAISTIFYDSGLTGFATVVTTTNVTIVANSVYLFNSGGGNQEYVRVINVVSGPAAGGITFRCKTTLNHTAGETLTGKFSIRASLPNGPDIATLIPFSALDITQAITVGAGGIQTIAHFAGMSYGRSPALTDLVHFIVQVDDVTRITNCIIKFNLDPNIIDFATNALEWTIPAGSFTSSGAWLDISVTVAALQGTLGSGIGRLGNDISLGLNTGVNAIQILFTVTNTINVQYLVLSPEGSYGPTVTAQEQAVFYCYKWRTKVGAVSNPSPPMRTGVNPNGGSVQVVGTYSSEAQMIGGFLDWYRFGGALLNYTYVGTQANLAGIPFNAFVDATDDLSVANNPLMAFDDFQPFPSIDLPVSGTVDVNGFTITWKSGDKFNLRWGAGTEITINGVVYTFYNRPTSTTVATLLQDGGTQFGVAFSIPQPILLAQPLPSLWGPTDNTGFFFACGDPLRPGTLYFTKGNNPDSAPDTNQIEVTSPAEPLMNGCLVNGLAKVYSTERAWWIYPQFAGVVATITGTQGSPWYLIEAISNRGLFARRGLCTDGGGTDFFISKDGIYASPGGSGSICITDSIYSLFPHEQSSQDIYVIGATTVNPPDYANPDAMALSFADGRLYFDYDDEEGRAVTLVFDVRARMWSVDVYSSTVLIHAPQVGNAIGALVGGTSVRQFVDSGPEVVTSILQPEFLSSKTYTYFHVKEFNIEYFSLVDLLLAFVPDQGQAMPSQTIVATIPTTPNQIKSLVTAPAGKMKLLQWTLSGNGIWRIWVDGLQAKVGQWGRESEYEVIQPFQEFSNTEAKQ